MKYGSPGDFRGAVGSWAARVAVVTTRHEDLVYGLTVSSFASLSVDPLLVLVCLANTNRIPGMIRDSGRFAISMLADDQEEVSRYFASSGREPALDFEGEFGTIEWHTGSPIIDGAIAHLDCELHELLPGGDHTIAVGRVLGAAFDAGRKPLVYFRRGYRQVVLE